MVHFHLEFTSVLRDFYVFVNEDFDAEVGGSVWLWALGGDIDFRIASAGSLILRNSAGNPIFKIDEATGNIHTKAGATIVDDL